jgi:hypothetical protein
MTGVGGVSSPAMVPPIITTLAIVSFVPWLDVNAIAGSRIVLG